MYAPTIRNDDFFTIKFKHIPTKATTTFEGWVTTFADNFSSQWNEVPVYGRMDPLSTFTRTSRKIQLAFDVPSDNAEVAQKNLERVNKLITFLYPLYDKQDGTGGQRVGHTLKAAPLIELKWTNLIADPGDNSGLIGYLEGVNYAPKIADGGFGRATGGTGYSEDFDLAGAAIDNHIAAHAPGTPSGLAPSMLPLPLPNTAYTITEQDSQLGSVRGSNIYIPKTLSISLSFTVLHKHLPGWVQGTTDSEYIFGNQQVNSGFPNTQTRHRGLALSTSTTVSTTNEDGESVTTEITQITSAFGTQILQSNK